MNVFEANSRTSMFELERMLSKADIISLNMPLTNKTKHFINQNILSLLKSNVTLINTSRGGLIDENALFSFLKTNKKATAFLDVLETEPVAKDFYLNKLNNVFITPHIGWNSVESIERLKDWLFDELMRA